MFRGFFASAEDIAMISFFEFSNFSKMAIRMFEFSNVWIFECFGEKNLWFWTVLNHLKSEPKGKERPGDKGKKIWLGWTVNIINHVDYRIYFHWNVFHLDDLYRYQGVYFVFNSFFIWVFSCLSCWEKTFILRTFTYNDTLLFFLQLFVWHNLHHDEMLAPTRYKFKGSWNSIQNIHFLCGWVAECTVGFWNYRHIEEPIHLLIEPAIS